MKRDDVIGGAMLLVVILVVGSFFMFAKQAPELAYGPVEVTGSTIDVQPETSSTNVDVLVSTPKAGFITIHESVGGAPGPIVGISALITEKSEGSLSISIQPSLTVGLSYIALLHVDNGDGKFVVKDDMPVTNGGASVRADFVVSKDDSVSK